MIRARFVTLVAVSSLAFSSASCANTRWKNTAPSSPTSVGKPLADFAVEFNRIALNTPSSLQAAIADAEPGSPAARYFSASLLNLRAYVGVGGFGRRLALIPVRGGVGYCGRQRGRAFCDEFQNPTFAADERLSGFTVNGVNVTRLVRLGSDTPSASFTLPGRMSGHVIALQREPLDALRIVVEVQNDGDASRPLPDGAAFSYREDQSPGTPILPVGYATPATVAPHASALISLTFEGANFGGTLSLNGAGTPQDVHVPGPPVVLPNTATEPA